MNSPREVTARRSTRQLPVMTDAVIMRSAQEPLTIEALYRLLQRYDPRAAQWLQDAVEEIAPANPAEKEKYALLALQLHRLLRIASE